MKQTIALSFLLLIFIILDSANAEIYQWVDKNGKIHFSDKAPQNDNVKIIDEQALTSRANSYTQVEITLLPIKIKSHQTAKKLVMYTTTNCGYCQKARKYFAKKKIAYIEKNIDMSDRYHREFKKMEGKGVPVLIWGKQKMTGFSISGFERTYKKLL